MTTLLIIFLSLSVYSCDLLTDDEEEDECTEGYAPSDCYETEPTHGTVNVSVTINRLNLSVPIMIYIDDYEYDNEFLCDTLTVSSVSYYLPNDSYSIRATYNAIYYGNPVIVHSINGGTLTYESEEYCDATCYGEGELDLDAEFEETLMQDF